MSYKVVSNWGWFKHLDCKDAYSVHQSDCGFLNTRNDDNCQGVSEEYVDAKTAILTTYFDDTVCRFNDALKEFGFWQMVKVCKCAGITKRELRKLVTEI